MGARDPQLGESEGQLGMRQQVEVWTCCVCAQRVSRIVGLAGGVLQDDGRLTLRTVVRGYCRNHRATVLAAWKAELAGLGSVQWVADPPAELRPRDVSGFLAEADSEFGFRSEIERSGTGQFECPHCGSSIKFGAGPHQDDSLVRPGSESWVCVGCGAAGLAYIAF